MSIHKATLVTACDNAAVRIPPEMGRPRDDQMIGTRMEQMVELAGRVCYDSLGKGRSSADYHQHLLDARHWSVYEHAVLHFTVDDWFTTDGSLMRKVCGVPGVCFDQDAMVLTFNLRHAVELPVSYWTLDMKRAFAQRLSHPSLVKAIGVDPVGNTFPGGLRECGASDPWTTLHLTTSRSVSHELVRHGDKTAFSQRSTRYVDEQFANVDVTHYASLTDGTRKLIDEAERATKSAYEAVVQELEPSLGRKEARSSARDILPNGLETQLIMSASRSQWQHILSMRRNPAAAKSIQMLAESIGEVLQL